MHALNHLRVANGHVEVAVDLACAQADAGHEVAIACGDNDFSDILAAHNVRHFHVPVRSGIFAKSKAFLNLSKSIHSFRPDIVNAHMVASALLAAPLRRLYDFKLVTTVHNSFDSQARLMRVGDVVIAVSDSVREELIGKGFSEKKLRTVRNGAIGGARRPLEPKKALTLQHPAVATVAGLHERKGVHDLLDAFAIVLETASDTHLYIVGDGPDRDRLEKQALEAGLSDRVHFLGYMKDPREVLASADVFVLASYAECYPLVVLEARHMGCALVGTDVVGTAEALKHGELGLLAPAADPPSLARQIISVIENPDLQRDLSKKARENLGECSVKAMSDATLALYSGIHARPS